MKVSNLMRPRILIVDDEPTLAAALRRLLVAKYQVFTATRSPDVLEALKSGERWDLIISDLMMPELTGMDLYEAVRQLDTDQAERFLFMTGGALTTRAAQFIAAQRGRTLDKPCDPARLRASVEAVLEATTSARTDG